MNLGLRPVKNLVYENWEVYSPDDILMFRTNFKKVKWYLDRDLAIKISDNSVKLLFKPEGNGHHGNEFFTSYKHNICVVCGTDKDLTRHHVVPHSFRRMLPEHMKSHNHHDVLLLCVQCHHLYESHADSFRQQLADKYSVSDYNYANNNEIEQFRIQDNAFKSARTLLFWKDSIPPNRINRLVSIIALYLNKSEITDEDIKSVYKSGLHKPKILYSHQLIMDKVDDYLEFIIEWRKHFINTMKPKFIPSGWDINYSFSDV